MTEPRVHREIERKLDVPARFRLPSLSGAGNGIGEVHRQPTLRLTAAYYDTADLRLARHRITLRRRTGGGDDGWHLKLPHADEATRDEVQLPLRTRDAPPVELTTLVLGITRGAPLLAVATLRTERRPSLVFDEHGRALAELTDDRVSVSIDGTAKSHFRELEVEAADGRTADDLQPVIAALVAAGAVESGFASKAVRALGPRAVEPPDVAAARSVHPREPAADALQALITRHVSSFIASDLGVRRGLPDAVHQMRVSARRLRSALKVFAPLMSAEWADALREELAWVAGALGASRDREVLETRLLAGLATMDDKSARRAEAVVRRELGAHEQQATSQVDTAMCSARYLALLDALVEAARTPQFSPAAAAPAAEALPPLMRATWKRLAREVRALHKHGHDDAWHSARIRAKHARYAADALAPVFGKPARKLAGQLARVTELLGTHQDAAIAADTARTLAAAKGVGGRAGYALGQLHDAQRAEVQRVRGQFVKVWPKVANPRWRRWLRAGATP